jgi:hypothetical protein
MRFLLRPRAVVQIAIVDVNGIILTAETLTFVKAFATPCNRCVAHCIGPTSKLAGTGNKGLVVRKIRVVSFTGCSQCSL